jgi:YD repeat-containing protein
VTHVRDAANNTIANIAYSPLGMKVAVADADLGAWSWTRNPLGETTALRDAKGQVTRFEYDALGRLTKRTSPDGTSNWSWGSTATKKNIGQLASLSGPGYSESFTSDSIGRPASQTIVSDSSTALTTPITRSASSIPSLTRRRVPEARFDSSRLRRRRSRASKMPTRRRYL